MSKNEGYAHNWWIDEFLPPAVMGVFTLAAIGALLYNDSENVKDFVDHLRGQDHEVSQQEPRLQK